MATEVNKELSSIVECCICTEIFTDPRMLPCIHTFCVKCLTETGLRAKKGPGDKMSCPLCRVEFVIPPGGFMGLQKNFFMDKIVNVVQLSSKYHVCESNKGDCSSAKWYCNECKQKLCSECSMINTKLHSVEHHTLVPFENQNIDKTIITEICASAFCDEHEREELKIFCNDCRVVLCALCFLEGHQSHKWSQVKEVANKFKTQIQSNMAILSSCEPEARSKLDQLEKDNIKFLETMSKVESEINKKKLEVKALLNKIVEENANSLLLELTSLKRTASKDKGIEQEEIDRHLTKLESHIMFCNDIATKGSDVDICRSGSELDNRAKELKELHSVAMKQKSATFRISFEERKPEAFLKKFGNLLGKIQDSDTGRDLSETLKTNSRQPVNENLVQLQSVWEAQLVDLLKQHKDNQPIFNWIRSNVTRAEAMTREFIRALVTAVCTRAIMVSVTSSNAKSASFSLSEAEIVSRQTLLQRYLDHKPDREIQALYALQALVHSLQHPSNILESLFNILYVKEIIGENAFWEWKNSSDPAEQNGRAVAFQTVRPFFQWLGEGTE